jgi:hypothetical protein
MTTATARTTKLQTQFEPPTKITVFTKDTDERANVLIVEKVTSTIHTDNGIQLQTANLETVFVAWSHVKYLITSTPDASV